MTALSEEGGRPSPGSPRTPEEAAPEPVPHGAGPDSHPPGEGGADTIARSILPAGLPDHPPCPFCGGRDTAIFSAFGSQLSVATYWCEGCRSPFEFMKWGGKP